MPVAVRRNIGQKFVTRAAAAVDAYHDGVLNPRQDWQASTLAAKERHRKAVTESLARDDWSRAIGNTPSSYQQQQAATLGPARFSQGVSQAGDKYERAVTPYLDTIAGLSLPPRGPKGDPTNMKRAEMVASALHAKKRSMGK